jgi:hypothetical protein
MGFTGSTVSDQPSKAKKPHIPCKHKEDMFFSHGVGKPVNGVSVCQLCVSTGREEKDDAPEQWQMGSVSAGLRTGRL